MKAASLEKCARSRTASSATYRGTDRFRDTRALSVLDVAFSMFQNVASFARVDWPQSRFMAGQL
jgi:hypothetical protein